MSSLFLWETQPHSQTWSNNENKIYRSKIKKKNPEVKDNWDNLG